MIELTDRARDALIASAEAARRFNPRVHLRLVGDTGSGVHSELVDAPVEGDAELDVIGTIFFVAPGLHGVVDAGEHNALSLRGASSPGP